MAARAFASVLGAVVGDAASLGLHWVYDLEQLKGFVAENGGAPEFQPAARSSWHGGKAKGLTSMYGATAVTTLKSLADNKGWVSGKFNGAYLETFGPGGSYVGYADKAMKLTVLNLLTASVEAGKALEPPTDLAVPGPVRMAMWRSVKPAAEGGAASAEELAAATEAAVKAAAPTASSEVLAWAKAAAAKLQEIALKPVGADDAQSSGFAKLAPVVGRYAGHRELLHVVTQAIRATQENEDAVSALVPCARILEAVVMGATPAQAVASCIRFFEQPLRAAVESAVKAAAEDGDYVKVVERYGNACDLSSSVPASVYLLLRPGATYTSALRENMLAGGDSAARACFLGAALAAVHGVGTAAGVPDAWVAATKDAAVVTELAAHLHVPVTGAEGHTSDHVEVHAAHHH